MDQLAIDLTGADDVSVGDTAILIDNAENSHLLAPNVAALSGSISNELLCRLGARLPGGDRGGGQGIKPDIGLLSLKMDCIL